LLCPIPRIGTLKLAAAWNWSWYARGCILNPYSLKYRRKGVK